jgi:adenylate cyclase
MGVEIERKFLVRAELWKAASAGTLYRQGYLSLEKGRTVRVRRAGDKAFVTIKGASVGLVRAEFEYEIPLADVGPLLALCIPPLIEKRRHLVPHEGHTWEVDEFLGDNAGLLVAEIELDHPKEAFARPAWVAEEVTDDARYLNSSLVTLPFSRWHTGK